MAEAPETIDILSARPGDIYGGYSSSEAIRDACLVGIYQGFEYWTPDERPLELWGAGILVHIPTRKGERTRTNTNWPRILRQRQYTGGLVKKKYIDALSDNDIIDSYITCSGYGAKFVPLDGLDLIIKRARSAEQFIAAIAPHTH
jgi:hypothetical protein